MDDQKPQDQDNQSKPVSIPINDIAPPPAEESAGQKINVMTSEGDDEEKNQTESPIESSEPETTPVIEEQPIEEASESEEQLSPVTAPPEEESTETDVEQHPTEEPSQTDDLFKQDEPAPTQSSAPAEMGVAASQMKAQKNPHRNNKKLATFVTIVTALLLAGIAVYVYMSANKNADSDNNTDTAQINGSSYETKQEEVKPATAEDIDQTIAEVEESLSTLDEADFSEESLSNNTLGL